MEGPANQGDRAGILPRIAEYLEAYLKSEVEIEISAIEIYCDKVRDLFG